MSDKMSQDPSNQYINQ